MGCVRDEYDEPRAASYHNCDYLKERNLGLGLEILAEEARDVTERIDVLRGSTLPPSAHTLRTYHSLLIESRDLLVRLVDENELIHKDIAENLKERLEVAEAEIRRLEQESEARERFFAHAVKSWKAEVDDLEEENARLREVLEAGFWIYDGEDYDRWRDEARKALGLTTLFRA